MITHAMGQNTVASTDLMIALVHWADSCKAKIASHLQSEKVPSGSKAFIRCHGGGWEVGPLDCERQYDAGLMYF